MQSRQDGNVDNDTRDASTSCGPHRVRRRAHGSSCVVGLLRNIVARWTALSAKIPADPLARGYGV
jgi:hypothetical protein